MNNDDNHKLLLLAFTENFLYHNCYVKHFACMIQVNFQRMASDGPRYFLHFVAAITWAQRLKLSHLYVVCKSLAPMKSFPRTKIQEKNIASYFFKLYISNCVTQFRETICTQTIITHSLSK